MGRKLAKRPLLPYDWRVVHHCGRQAWLRRTALVAALVTVACTDQGPFLPPSQLAILTHPGNSAADGAITPALLVAIQDAQGQTVTSATRDVTVAIAINPTGAALSGTLSVNAVNGVATFTDLHITRVGTGYALGASSSGLTSARSGTFDVAPGAPTHLAFTGQPSNATAGAAITPAVQVAVRDASDNVVTTGTGNVTLAILANPSGGTLSGTTTVATASGVATFTNLSINRTGSGSSLSASAPGLGAATSNALNITPGPATQLVVTRQPGRARLGVAITPAVQVTIGDALGNAVTTATQSVSVAIGNNPGGATLSGTTTKSPVSGVATFPDLKLDKAGTGYTLAVSATGLAGATSAAFDVSPPLVFTTVTTGGAGRGSHSCGVATDGAAYCWGDNGNGQLGDDTHFGHSIPLAVQAPTGVTFQSVSAGGQHSCAVTPGNVAYCWGRNEYGRLGDGSGEDRTAPSQVAAPAGVTFSAVSSGKDGHSCGLATSGAVYCWGWGGNGGLGNNSFASTLAPVLTQAPPGVTFTAITTGVLHSCALATNGDVYCWGNNGSGQLGDSSTVERTTPVRARAPSGVTFVQVDAGYSHTCAVTASGAAYCWGANYSGQLGDSTTESRSAPTPVHGSLQFAGVTSGGYHSCGVTTTGVGYCWGSNFFGQLGDNTTVDKLAPTAVGGGGLTLGIASAGLFHTCALATAPTAGMYCWGSNGGGELGDGTITQRIVPTRAVH